MNTQNDEHLYAEAVKHWTLDPSIMYLNHGSFGACPDAVLAKQKELKGQLETHPMRFYLKQMDDYLTGSLETLGGLLGAKADNLVFVQNATSGVNTVLRSLTFNADDEILMTNLGYNACNNAVRYVAGRYGARAVEAKISFPVMNEQEVVDAILERVTNKTKLAVVDHITSGSALIFPIKRIVSELKLRGVEVLVDGAHGPGMAAIDLEAIGAGYYTGNCHKWLCGPKSAAFLYIRKDLQEPIYPLTISHGYNHKTGQLPELHERFNWQGTVDMTAAICAGEAVKFLDATFEGGVMGLAARNRELTLKVKRYFEELFGVESLAPEYMIGSIATVALPDLNLGDLNEPSSESSSGSHYPLMEKLRDEYGIQSMTFPLGGGKHAIRISVQAFNTFAQYEKLGEIIQSLRA